MAPSDADAASADVVLHAGGADRGTGRAAGAAARGRADDPRGAAGRRAGARDGGRARGSGGDDAQGAAVIPLPAGMRVWIATGHTDMRKGMQGLALLVQE